MIRFPYGVADFHGIRTRKMLYVDRTAHIRDVENLGDVLVFLRPRRFGKSLWLQTLANYYDLRRAEEFDDLFGDLAIGRKPTPLAHRYFVLQWNFSTVDPTGGVEQIAESLREHVATRTEAFVSDYRDHLPASVNVDGSPAAILSRLLSVVRRTPYKLYLLIDEYDNFINEVMVRDVATYRALIETRGPYKQLFKSVKNATEGQGMEKVFVAGVSPVALNDLTSGFNNAENASADPVLATLCGFREEEIHDLLDTIAAERDLSREAVEQAARTLRTWYDGYRFAAGVTEPVYNPTNTLYFLKHLYRRGEPPEELHDENLRTDRGKLRFLGRTAAGTGVVERLTEGGGKIDVARLEASFSVDDLTTGLAKDQGVVASFLYYLGLLTLDEGSSNRLRIPNPLMERLFLDRLLETYLPERDDSYAASEVAMRFFRDGEIQPLLDFFEEKLFPVFSNRDRGRAPKKAGQGGSGINEMVVKTLFLSMLFNDTRYVVHSEPELQRRYADLCLLVRPDMRRYGYFDLLFEFKLVRLKELGKKGEEIRAMDDTALRELPAVAKAFSEARDQAAYYRAALLDRHGAELKLRAYIVVAVGLERMLGEEETTRP